MVPHSACISNRSRRASATSTGCATSTTRSSPGWFEQARNPIYRIFNPEFAFESWNLILARYEIDFVRPLVINGDVTVRTWVSRIGTSSFEVSQQALQGGALCTRGTTVLVHYDFGAARPVPIPAAIRERLREHARRAGRGGA